MDLIPRETLDGLKKAGFKLGWGIDGSGFLMLAWTKGGGYYLGTRSSTLRSVPVLTSMGADVGTSMLISDGKVKLKNDSPIKGFTETGLEFENGTTLDADVVIFATGCALPFTFPVRTEILMRGGGGFRYTNVREPIHKICEPDVADRVNTIWGLDEEGEINGAWRDTGVEGLYVMMGAFALCPFVLSNILMTRVLQETSRPVALTPKYWRCVRDLSIDVQCLSCSLLCVQKSGRWRTVFSANVTANDRGGHRVDKNVLKPLTGGS